jgi:hypothetical protein
MMYAIADKNDQLSKYHEAGAETILLLESEDIALTSFSILYKAFLRAHKSVPAVNIDQIWMARTYEEHSRICCFLGEETLMQGANPPNFMFGSRHSEYWAAAIERDNEVFGTPNPNKR